MAVLPWGSVNPGNYLGEWGGVRWAPGSLNQKQAGWLGEDLYGLGESKTSIEDIINTGLQTIGQVFGRPNVPVPGTGLTPMPQYQPAAVASPLAGLGTPLLLGGAALLAVMLLTSRRR